MTKGQGGSSLRVLEAFPLSEQLKSEFSKFLDLLRSSKRILVSSTLTSDGDSIGSQIALLYLIEQLNPKAEVKVVNESPVPHRYQFLSRTSDIQTMESWEASGESASFDLGITLDGGIERTGSVAKLFESIPETALIDHHVIGSEMQYAANLLDLESSSTCEIVYCLYEFANLELAKEAAEHIYIGMVFDTGFFKHSITKPRTHHVAAQLVAKGIDFSNISDRAILERSWGGQLLLKRLLDHMEISDCGKVVSSYWSHDDLSSIDFKDGDQEGMINQLYFTEGSEAVVLFVETSPNQIKLSFRSKGQVNVAEFARELNPKGGGHVRAAGCSLSEPLDQVRKRVTKKLIDSVS